MRAQGCTGIDLWRIREEEREREGGERKGGKRGEGESKGEEGEEREVSAIAFIERGEGEDVLIDGVTYLT